MKKVRILLLTVIAGCVLSIPTIAFSFGINCVLEDLDDSLGTGGDLWLATYSFDFSSLRYEFEMNDILAVKFSSSNYQSIAWVDDELSFFWSDGDNISYPDSTYLYFESLTGVEGIVGNGFSIQFIWAGSGDPGADQTWGIYGPQNYLTPFFPLMADDEGSINVTEIIHLQTTAPAPSTILLLGAGLAAIAGCRRRASNSE